MREGSLFAVGNCRVKIGSSDGSSRRSKGSSIAIGLHWNSWQWISFADNLVHVATSCWLLVVGKLAKSCEEVSPGIQSLAGPDPEAGSDSDSQTHEVLEHQHGEVGVGLVTSRPAVRTGVAGLPLLGEHQFIEPAGNHCPCWDNVEHTEYSNLDHQLFKFINLGSAALFFDDVPDLEQADEACGEEGDTEE